MIICPEVNFIRPEYLLTVFIVDTLEILSSNNISRSIYFLSEEYYLRIIVIKDEVPFHINPK